MSGADPHAIAKMFSDSYYNAFDTNRGELQSFYRKESMLTWEGTPIQGATSIVEKLTTLPFEKVQHKVTTLDAQPGSRTTSSVIVAVSGLLVVDGSQDPFQFNEVFQLIPDGDSHYVLNDIFRLNYG